VHRTNKRNIRFFFLQGGEQSHSNIIARDFYSDITLHANTYDKRIAMYHYRMLEFLSYVQDYPANVKQADTFSLVPILDHYRFARFQSWWKRSAKRSESIISNATTQCLSLSAQPHCC
jgi:hypothetical protein